jgi:hypothetical protein
VKEGLGEESRTLPPSSSLPLPLAPSSSLPPSRLRSPTPPHHSDHHITPGLFFLPSLARALAGAALHHRGREDQGGHHHRQVPRPRQGVRRLPAAGLGAAGRGRGCFFLGVSQSIQWSAGGVAVVAVLPAMENSSSAIPRPGQWPCTYLYLIRFRPVFDQFSYRTWKATAAPVARRGPSVLTAVLLVKRQRTVFQHTVQT